MQGDRTNVIKNKPTLQPEILLSYVWQKIPPNIKITFFSTLAIGFLVHAYMFTNKLPTHDEIGQAFSSFPGMIHSGRWLLSFASFISSYYSMPWVNGLLALVYLSIAVCLVCSSLKITNNFYCILISGLMVSTPILAATFSYMQCSDPYCLSIMLMCLTVFFAERYKYGYIFAIIPLVLSLAIYQAYYGIAVGLMIMILIFNILRNDPTQKQIIIKGLRFLFTLGAGIVLYIFVTKIILLIANKSLVSYQNVDQMGSIVFSNIPKQIGNAYSKGISFFLRNTEGIYGHMMAVMFALSFLLCIFLLFIWCKKEKIHNNPVRLFLLLTLLVIFPLGCNIIYLFGASDMHTLMKYGTVIFVLILPSTLSFISNHRQVTAIKHVKTCLQEIIHRISTSFMVIAILLCIFTNFIVSNKVYFILYFANQQAYAQAITLASRIQLTDNYTIDKEIVLVDNLHRGGRGSAEPRTRTIPGLDSLNIVGLHDGASLFNSRRPGFFHNWLGSVQKTTSIRDGVIEDATVASIVSKMPRYPDDGSIRIIGNKIYVNFILPTD